MIGFSGEVKGSHRKRCGCAKCQSHDRHPELVGRPLSPEEFAKAYPAVNATSTPTTEDPQITEAWKQVEQAQAAFDRANKVWENALIKESRDQLKYGGKRIATTYHLGNMPDDPVRVAQDMREEAAEALRQANVRYADLMRQAEYRDRVARADARRQASQLAEAEALQGRRQRFGL